MKPNISSSFFLKLVSFCFIVTECGEGNPFVMETLWSPWNVSQSEFCYETESWMKLKEKRKCFITQQAVAEHISYAKDQLDRHKKKTLPGKRIYHIPRLLFN